MRRVAMTTGETLKCGWPGALRSAGFLFASLSIVVAAKKNRWLGGVNDRYFTIRSGADS